MILKNIVLTLVLTLVLGLIAESALAADGVKPSLPQELKVLLEEAEKGDARAQGLIAQHYSGGNLFLGCSKSTAEKWARLSSEQGHPFGMFVMGLMLADGDSGDRVKANELLRRCAVGLKELAEAGDASAQSMLGVLNFRGMGGLNVNRQEAIKWLSMSAEQGSSWGQSNLGIVLSDGPDGAKQRDKVIQLYKSAVAKGNLNAHVGLASIYQDMENPELAAKAVELCKVAAEAGHPMAQNNLGYAYLRANGVARDYPRALDLFSRAAAQGVKLGHDNLDWFRDNSSLPLHLRRPDAAEAARPPVLSLGEVLYAGCAQFPYPAVCFADRVITELLSRYECFVAYRSLPYGFPAEDVLRYPVSRARLFPAHLMASALYVPQDEKAQKGFEGHVWCYELTDQNFTRENRDIIRPYSVDDVARSIADALAYRMNAGPKAEAGSKPVDVKGWQFEVAPLTRLNAGRRCKEVFPSHMKYFDLLKPVLEARAGAGNVSSSKAVDLEKAPGLKGIISWSVSRHGKDKWIVDMHMLDPKTMLYVSAASVVSDTDKPEGIEYGLLFDRLFANIRNDVPGIDDGDQLLDREAQMFMSYANSRKLIGSWTIEGRYPNYGVSWTRYVATRACERAFFLKPDDPVTSYMALWTLSNVMRLNTLEGSNFPGANNFTQNAAALMVGVLQRWNPGWQGLDKSSFSSYSFYPQSIIPEVFHAETLVFLKRYDEAIKVAGEAFKQYPTDERLAIALVDALVGKKRNAEAIAVIKNFKEKHGASTRMANAELILAKSAGDDSMRYKAVRSAVINDRKMRDEKDWLFFLEAWPQEEGPEKAIREMFTWLERNKRIVAFPMNSHFAVRLRQAECFEMLEQKEAAVRRAKDVVATSKQLPGTQSYTKKAEDIIKRLEAEIGQVEELWKTPAELGVEGSKYTIYLAALGDGVPDQLIDSIGKHISDYTGVKYKELPGVKEPSPRDRDMDGFYRRVFDGYAVPSDALIMCFVAMYCVGGNEVATSAQGNPVFLGPESYYTFETARVINIYAQEMAAGLFQSFRSSYSRKTRDSDRFIFSRMRCPNDPCMLAEYPGQWKRDMRFSLCPDCQKEYKEQSLVEINARLIKHLKEMGAVVKPVTE